MRFQSIHIKNFRGIKEASLNNLKDFNIILGKNNACKTTLLEAIFSITGMSNPQIPDNINSFRSITFLDKDSFRYLFYNLDFDNIPEIEAHFDKNEAKRTLKIKPEITNSIVKTIKTKIEDLGSSASSSNETPVSINGIQLDFSYKEKHQRVIHGKSKMVIDNENARIETDRNYKEKLSSVFVMNSFMKLALSGRLEKIIVEKREQAIVDVLKKIDSSIQRISLVKNKVYLDIGGNRLMPINLMGDGIIKVLYLIVTIYDNRNKIILIDEIGNGLHYSAIKTLWKAVFEAAKQFNTQLFITTHNREILKYLNEVLEEDDFKEYQDKVMIQTVRKLDNNILKAYSYGFDELHHAIEYDNEIR